MVFWGGNKLKLKPLNRYKISNENSFACNESIDTIKLQLDNQ